MLPRIYTVNVRVQMLTYNSCDGQTVFSIRFPLYRLYRLYKKVHTKTYYKIFFN